MNQEVERISKEEVKATMKRMRNGTVIGSDEMWRYGNV